jgi:hypothetical protein
VLGLLLTGDELLPHERWAARFWSPIVQARHRPRRVVLEHEPRRVRRRAAGLPQRPGVDDDQPIPPARGEVVGDAGAGDPGANDHRPR